MEEKKNSDGLIKSLCYLGIFVLLIFIILPPLFRVVFEEETEIKENEEKKLIMNLSCVKTEDFMDYKIKTMINTNYIDNKISDSVFTYEIEYADSIFSDEEVIIEEYETLKRVNNVDFYEKDNRYTISINYTDFDYTSEDALLNHQKMIADQMYYYTEMHFECETTRIQ